MGKLKRSRYYMIRGHQSIALFISVFNFLTIQYFLLVSSFSQLEAVFPTFLWFALLVGTGYLMFATFLGWKDITRDWLGAQTEAQLVRDKIPAQAEGFYYVKESWRMLKELTGK